VKPQIQSSRRFFPVFLFVFICLMPMKSLHAQDYVTGSFEGEVKDSITGSPIAGATVRITNQETGVPTAKQTDAGGRFRQGLLPPGDYTITVLKQGYVTQTLQRSLPALRPTVVLPPVPMVPETTAVATVSPTPDPAAAPTPTPAPGATPVPTTQPTTSQQTTASDTAPEADIRAEINTIDAQRGGTFNQKEVSTLPLGATTLTRTFDELGLLLPGVAPAPQTLGTVGGPGVGAGVGSAGQFSVNGIRSRSNNFTVDGSDNNDEDIGVRRQGFFALIAQPIESIREFQMITLLAPAQFGRNMGAQVNAISKSGGNDTHGTLFGLFNSSKLNARNTFDRIGANTRSPLQGRILNADNSLGVFRNVYVNDVQRFVSNDTGAEDSFTLGQGGLVIGGPLVPNKLFYFFALEGQLLNANKEVNFAVPTIEQRGAFRTGATGLARDPFTGRAIVDFPTTVSGDAIFSFFPFPNNPDGVYGRNTFTQVLPASAQGKVASGKVDYSFKVSERQQSFTGRYNFTSDWRDMPVTGGGLFSRLRPRVRTQNFTTFLNSELTNPDSTRPIFNQLRLSYGRTRLIFDEGRDPQENLLPINRRFNNPDDAGFLLNARFLVNDTLPNNCFTPGVVGPCVNYDTFGTGQTETVSLGDRLGPLGPIGQIKIAGFSPVGVDVFNFPQRRVNNTYQVADTVTISAGKHSFAFGTDIRRTELLSDLPRNSRPLLTFNGAPRLVCSNPACSTLAFASSVPGQTNAFVRPEDFAAAGAPSGVFQSLVLPGRDADINLRYHQWDFFGQDELRIRPNLSLSYGLRYEYNTPPREVDNRIESTFGATLPAGLTGLSNFIEGRTKIFDPDKNNFAPRVGFAYSPDLFGSGRATVIRAGYGLYHDQILGAVVSQSRNVFPTFSTINFGGGCCDLLGILDTDDNGELDPDRGFNIFNPLGTFFGVTPIIQPGTLNTINPALALGSLTAQQRLIDVVNRFFPSFAGTGFGATLPQRHLETPMAHQYSVTFEQQLNSKLVVSAAYVGTRGRNLLRFASPNLGSNYLIMPLAFNPGASSIGGATFTGFTIDPGGLSTSSTGVVSLANGRPINTIGPINRFEATASSRYDALQLQLRGRYKLLGETQFQVNYTYGKVTDDVSDVFDLAGAPALPQNSVTFLGERGPANFDVRHRATSNYISDFSSWGKNNSFLHAIFNGLEVAGTGTFQTGQPFTVNSIFDVNLDGNLTDRLNSTSGIELTGDRAQPLRLNVNPISLLAPIGQDGAVPRNSFRAGNLWVTNAAVIKTINFSEHKKLIFRTEVFNFFNRANFGIPVRFLESPGFGRATETVTPARRIQFGLKFSF